MKLALEAEEKSLHPTHKVGALICGYDNSDHFYAIAHANHWPPLLEQHIGRETKLGKASTTVHAEVAAILKAPATDGAEIYVTDLPCPNCAKIMAEARIKTIYIDSHTHNTPLGKKLKPFFDDISLPILQSAGIQVFEMDCEQSTIHELGELQTNILRPIERPVHHIPLEGGQIHIDHFNAMIEEQHAVLNAPFAACYAKSDLDQYTFLCAQSHRSMGLTKNQAEEISAAQNKYTPTIQPINRLLLTCARYGLKIDENYLYSSQTPSSREFVNLIGAGYTSLSIGDKTKCIDEWGIMALKQLTNHNILKLI